MATAPQTSSTKGVVNGLECRRPRLHECEARKSAAYLRLSALYAAEAATLQAGTPAFQSHPPPLRRAGRGRLSPNRTISDNASLIFSAFPHFPLDRLHLFL